MVPTSNEFFKLILLGRLPLDPRVTNLADSGAPFAEKSELAAPAASVVSSLLEICSA